MKTRAIRTFEYSALLVLTVLLSACAGRVSGGNRATTRPVIVEGLDVNVMNAVFVRGFGEITERALQNPKLDDLFVAALAGLKTIDPHLDVKAPKGHMAVFYNDREVANLGTTSKRDIETWSFTTLRALVIGRKVSPLLKAADEETIYKAVFASALTVLDPYSRYATRLDAAGSRLVREGVIGLGVRLELSDGGALVKALVNEGPGDIAGLKLNDTIIEANGVSLANRSLADIRRRLDGSAGTTVTLTVRRPGGDAPFVVSAALELVVPDTVTSHISGGVLELAVRSFNQRTAYAVERAVTEARRYTKLKGIVLDLRGNPGGLLDQAVEMSDLFLDDGTIVTLRGRHPGANQDYAAHPGDIASGIPIAVIVDGKSASAAEIVAAALQDNHRAAVVGTVSWGKGSVQTLRRLPNGAEVALTWARAQSPRGVALHGLGLLPNICLSGQALSVGDVTDRIFAGPSPGDNTLDRWRTAKDDPAVHEALRRACPAELHPDRELDMDVALRIVTDPTLLALTIPDDAPQLAVKP